VTIVMPAIPPKGAKNQLRRETGVPAPYPSSAEWMEKGRTGVGPIVAAVSRRHSNESRLFSSPGRPGQTMTPLTGRAAFSLTLRLSQWFEIHKPPVDSSRPVSANSGHSRGWRTGPIDPKPKVDHWPGLRSFGPISAQSNKCWAFTGL
jgi:hypothetical protein